MCRFVDLYFASPLAQLSTPFQVGHANAAVSKILRYNPYITYFITNAQ